MTTPYNGSYDLGVLIGQLDRVWQTWFNTHSGICSEYDPDHQYYCTLAIGHHGNHDAHGYQVLRRWGLPADMTLTEGL